MARNDLARYSKPMTQTESIEVRRKKALFRAQRRGFRELDLVFAAFTDSHLERLDGTQLEKFEALLSVPDWQIYGWIMGHEAVPGSFDHDVFALLRDYRSNLKP
ncbi:MAG TPA: succinate dehydrogenase assembly factor 2 [Micropepsaceae bacterium]|jgi:antitoxin CptB|nr:succinate dehydrogenase assembly factor 2 [Micropepsaceae bacterium]